MARAALRGASARGSVHVLVFELRQHRLPGVDCHAASRGQPPDHGRRPCASRLSAESHERNPGAARHGRVSSATLAGSLMQLVIGERAVAYLSSRTACGLKDTAAQASALLRVSLKEGATRTSA